MKTYQVAAASTCALAIIRTTTEFSPRSKIVSAAAFTAVDDTISTTFEIRSAIVPPSLSREQAIQHISGLVPLGATVVVRAPRMPRGLKRHLAAGRQLPAPTDAQSLTEERRDLDVRPVSVPEQALEAVTEYFGLHRASQDDSIAEKARRSEEEAQALYLAHLFGSVCEHDRIRLAAAYQAWALLRKATPLGTFGAAEEF